MKDVGEPGSAAGTTWYKDAVFYEAHVRAFADSNGDGIGDFQGLIGKLDYLRDLGITAIWLLPFFPSPLRDDGYDISDYTAVHPAYGNIGDFQRFLDEAHQRDLKVIIELVLNHTSEQHPWFQRARRAPTGSCERNFYVWSDTPERYQQARVIFEDYEQSNWSWDPVAEAYYWHRFYSHQPDLNYDHPPVREAIFNTVDFWLEMGVDGLRLDAVPYLVERERTSSENLPETHQVLKMLRDHIDTRFAGRMLLAEANQWPEDAVAYFGDGNECHMAFHFPLMPRLFMALRTEDRLPVVDIMQQTPPIPDSCQWAIFLRNHDELTLEMVTEEERLYMYRAFAPAEESRINLGIRRRLAPLLGNSRRRMELMNALICSLPGTPVIYYGDEIGMGDNIYLGDRDGVRTPMQWSADRNAGFSAAPQQRLYKPLIVDYEYHHETVHVEAQEQNPHSLLGFMKRLLALRKRHHAFGRGSLQLLQPMNHRVLAFIREHEEESILIVANLSRFSQAVELDLGAYEGQTPVELFGRTQFWPVGAEPYRLTLGPHAFFWFDLSRSPASNAVRLGARNAVAEGQALPLIATQGAWRSVVAGQDRYQLMQQLPDFLGDQPWFRGQPDSILNVSIIDAIPLRPREASTWLVPISVAYSDRDAENYLLALHALPADADGKTGHELRSPIARLHSAVDGEAVLVDAIEQGTSEASLEWVTDKHSEPLRGSLGELVVLRTDEGETADPSRVISHVEEQSGNIRKGEERVLVKVLRRIGEGTHPEWEIGSALTDNGFPHVPAVLGALEYRRAQHPPMTLAVLQALVPHEGNAWQFTLGAVDEFLGEAMSQGVVLPHDRPPTAMALLDATDHLPPQPLASLLAAYLPFARLLGQRTAELHSALASIQDRPAFAPEPQTTSSQRSLYQSMRGLTSGVLRALRHVMVDLDGEERELAVKILNSEGAIYDRFRTVLMQPLTGAKIRTHGDLHLGQVLRVDDDIMFVDFEGEPDRYLEERRLKESPLRDLASMLHSFRDAAMTVAERRSVTVDMTSEERATIEALALAWYRWCAALFLTGYLDTAGDAAYLPAPREEWATLLDAMMLEKAIYALGYGLNHAPHQPGRPLRNVLQMLRGSESDQ